MRLWLARTRYGFLALAAMTGICAGVAFAQAPAEQAQAPVDNGGVSGTSDIKDLSDAMMDPNLYVGLQEAYQHTMALRTPEVQPQELSSLFFTLWQHRLLEEQRVIGRNVRPTDPGEQLDKPGDRIMGIRELSLGGIVFASAKNWVVWLNGQRVTPDAIPKQVIDIQVYKDYIELKWFDSYTSLIYPVRMRPHQRFNLDARMFLPGTPS